MAATYTVVDHRGDTVAAFTWADPGPQRDPLYSALRVMCQATRRRVLRDGRLLATCVSAHLPQRIDAYRGLAS